MNAVDEFLSEWHWARELSISLLQVLSEDTLTKQPIPSAGAWWKQFRHLARVQENYIQALRTGIVAFTTEQSCYLQGPNREALVTYLKETDQKLLDSEKSPVLREQIDWFGTPTNIHLHLVRLLSHETLHHGQFIAYARHTGLQLPRCWEAWGEGGNT